MTGAFTVACVQLNSGPEIGANIEATAQLVREARKAGASDAELTETAVVAAAMRAGAAITHATHMFQG